MRVHWKTLVLSLVIATLPAMGQAPARQPQAGGRGGRGARRPSAFPEHPPADPAMVERGKAIFGVNCAFCHGSDARGGEGGPNLLRSELVLNDKSGELIMPVVQNGRPERGMPKIDLKAAQVEDVAAYIHSFRVGGYDVSRMTPPSILVGDAKAGEVAFQSKCASCHSVTGDLKGLATKIDDPKTLQNTWLMPGGGRGGFGAGRGPQIAVAPTTVTVITASGQRTEGKLLRIDDFYVSLTDTSGAERTFRLGGGTTAQIHDPVEPHKEMLPKYTDKEIHDLTAYLVTLK